MRPMFLVGLASVITASCGAAERSAQNMDSDSITFRAPLYTTPSPKEISFRSCGDASRSFFEIARNTGGELNCSRNFSDKRRIVRAGPAAHCEANYCATFLLDPPLSDGTILGTRLPDTRGNFSHVAASQAGDRKFYTLKSIEEIAPDSRSPKFGGVIETEWNYLIDFKGYGRQIVTLSPIGASLISTSTIEITPVE